MSRKVMPASRRAVRPAVAAGTGLSAGRRAGLNAASMSERTDRSGAAGGLDYRCPMIRQSGVLVAIVVALAVGCGPGTATPESLQVGRGVYAGSCSTCHGNRGQGGVGPSLSNVRDTWPSCDDQQEWVSLGSEGWKLQHGPVYGAEDTPIKSVMPGHAETLTTEEIAAVAAFERVEYGGGDPAVELAACGVAVP